MHATDYRELAASEALQPFVECFWLHGPQPEANLSVLPDTCTDIVFSRTMGLKIVGTMTRPLVRPASEDCSIGVRFRPGMARLFINAPAVELVDRVLPLKEYWGTRGQALEENLRNARKPEKMLAILRGALQTSTPISPVQSALEFLASNAGSISLQEISRQAGISTRQLRRRCLEETGITPKQLARIARFRRACTAIPSRSDWNLARLAVECGYYDQSHFIHDFRKFSGSTPSDYVRFLQYR